MRHRQGPVALGLLSLLACGPVIYGVTVPDLVDQVSELQYRHYLDNRLFAHDGDNRSVVGPGPEHDPCRDNIVEDFESFGLPTVFEIYPTTPELTGSTNVVATKIGKVRPDEIWIVSAHYDSRDNPGANDNASGVASMLEVARVLSQHDFEATIRFIAFDSEETDRSGSRAYAPAHVHENILGVVNYDMIAYNPGNLNEAHITHRVYTPLQDDMAAMVLVYGQGLIPIVAVRYVGVDSDSFATVGIPAFNMVERYPANPHYHEPTDSVDTPGYIDYTFAAKITRCVVGFVATKAVLIPPSDPVPPTWVGDLMGRRSTRSGAVDLTWTAPADSTEPGGTLQACTDYELRHSSSPILHDDGGTTWDAATPVTGLATPKMPGAAESFTVTGLTGDATYYFALRASDALGNVSEVSNCAPAQGSVLGERVLQAGLDNYSGDRDSYIVADSPANYGASDGMMVRGYSSQGNSERCLVRFGLNGLPTNAQLTSAALHLYSYDSAVTTGSEGLYGAYPLTRSWSESEVNWTHASLATAWTTPGGDFLPAPDATAAKQVAAGVWYRFDVTVRVQDWLNGSSNNHGWIVKCTDETLANQDRFHASETTSAALRPYLRITDLQEPVACDTNDDGLVDVVDLLTLVYSFGASRGVDRHYDPWADFSADGAVDVVDLLILVENWPVDGGPGGAELLEQVANEIGRPPAAALPR